MMLRPVRPSRPIPFISLLFTLAAIFFSTGQYASAGPVDSTAYAQLQWRMIGPFRGGRTVAAVGVPEQPNLFYIGVNNGGVWRSNDYGRTWDPIFDDQPTGSIGALGIAPSNPSILYAGSGEGLQRPDLSTGDGMFKSTDAGKSWRFIGLGDAQQIGAVRVDPRNPERVYVAVLGHPYGPNKERGVFRSLDGGKSWENVLYKDENTGAIGLVIDPSNANRIYATLWAARQGPWENGGWQGPNSGLFRSEDGGTTWTQITGGLPGTEQGLGRIGIAVAPSDPSRLYALVEANKEGGFYRSDDMGAHWRKTNTEDRVSGRGSDFAELQVDPRNKDLIFVANTSIYRSTDGGTTFHAFIGAPGGDDYHTIWINPLHPEIMLVAADQGAIITVNGGESWSSWYNQPTAQFYHVITNNEFPYFVYGAQQESGSAGIVSRGNDGQITFREWHPVAADEWAYIAPDPLNPDIIYGGKVTRFDRRTEQVQNVAPEAVRSGKYRFLRTSPLMFSPADPHALYLASNVLFKTTNGGYSWTVNSPDLSREKAVVPGTDTTFKTPERRGVIYSLGLSPLDRNLIWAGTDDGLVHRSTDDGAHWTDVTPKQLTSWSKIAGMDAGHFDAGTAYIAVNRMKLDDLHPHIYRTHDGGKSWKEIVDGLPGSGPVNIVREDPLQAGLLFAGTERAVYVSFDDGNRWHPLRLNMPATSIRDLVLHDNDVVVGTHGRSFWILDDMAMLRQLAKEKSAATTLFPPTHAVRVRWGQYTDTPLPPDEPAGANPPDGAIIDYRLAADAKVVDLEIFDGQKRLVRRFSTADPRDTVREEQLRISREWLRPEQRLSAAKGSHRFVWDLHYAPPTGAGKHYPISAIYHNTAAQPTGPWVLPGTYTVVLTVDGKQKSSEPMEVSNDPRAKASPELLSRQFELSSECYNDYNELASVLSSIGSLRKQIEGLKPRAGNQATKDSLASLDKRLAGYAGDAAGEDIDVIYFTVDDGPAVHETVTGLQTKLLYLMALMQNADAQPTEVQVDSINKHAKTFTSMLAWWKSFTSTSLPAINSMLIIEHLPPLEAK